jgi:o-succinylbenzoate---CoA ligase
MERAELKGVFSGLERRARRRARFFVSEADQQTFMAEFSRGVAGFTEVFLCDPAWGAAEQSHLDALRRMPMENDFSKTPEGWLMIPTGGSSGEVKFARHDEQTITSAVLGFTRHFGLKQVNAAGLLPLHHVSGFMAWMRCSLTGGEYRPLDWKQVEGGNLPVLPDKPEGWVISLVPTQLDRLLRQEQTVAWLRKFRIIFLGGAHAWAALLERAAVLRLPLSPGYGMTETAAMVTALQPDEFLSGVRSCGRPLPHGQVSMSTEGVILIESDSLFRGYYPGWRKPDGFRTSDLGAIDARGHLQVQGRNDAGIITGGEKVHPAEVEAVLLATGHFEDVVVVGLPDSEWGQIVVAVYPESRQPDLAKVNQALAMQLAPAKRPKRWVPLKTWPRNEAGKVNRAEIARLIAVQT